MATRRLTQAPGRYIRGQVLQELLKSVATEAIQESSTYQATPKIEDWAKRARSRLSNLYSCDPELGEFLHGDRIVDSAR